MIDIIAWVKEIEQLAYDVYTRTADYFHEDKRLTGFLKKIAEDERWHDRSMKRAMDYCIQNPSTGHKFPSAVTIDPETDQRIRTAFQEITDKIDSGQLTRRFLFEKMITTESSEWNDMFLYVVNTLKNTIPEFKSAAARFQGHKRAIEYFLEENNFDSQFVSSLRGLPSVWNERILIIEDDESIAELIQAILDQEGRVDIALNGIDGLAKIKKTYYKLIISDVDMPKMDGITCYNQAAVLFPDIHDRYLFFTGNPSSENLAFLKTNRLAYLTKPSHISEIRDQALGILLTPGKKAIA